MSQKIWNLVGLIMIEEPEEMTRDIAKSLGPHEVIIESYLTFNVIWAILGDRKRWNIH